MKLQIMSDLHLEFGDFKIKNKNDADVLVLSGDITSSKSLPEFKQFINDASREFNQIIHISGNHEPYGSSIESMNKVFNSISLEVYNYNYLDVRHLTYSLYKNNIARTYIFIGGTLWTDFNGGNPIDMQLARKSMNDYRAIKMFTPQKALQIHSKTVKYIREIAQTNQDKTIVVVTHHAPTMKSISPKYTNELDHSYASDLSGLILNNPNIKLWTHGHTHASFDYTVGECRVLCNPRGYVDYEENTEFNPDLIVEV